MAQVESNLVLIVAIVIMLGVAGVLSAALALIVFLIIRRPKRARFLPEPDLHIDLNSLVAEGPLDEWPQLEFYNLPVRMALVVFAPVGREGALPKGEDFPAILEYLAPGMGDVFLAHRPEVRQWPPQLSSEGFIHSFFRNASLPGNDGRNTPWCGIAGKFKAGDHAYLVGFLCCGAAPNSLTRAEVHIPTGWLDVLRVRGATTNR